MTRGTLLSLVIALSSTACSLTLDFPELASCSATAPCPNGQSCVDGVCVADNTAGNCTERSVTFSDAPLIVTAVEGSSTSATIYASSNAAGSIDEVHLTNAPAGFSLSAIQTNIDGTSRGIATLNVASSAAAGASSFSVVVTVEGCSFTLPVSAAINSASCNANMLTFAADPVTISTSTGVATSVEVAAHSDQSRAFGATLSGAPSGITLSSIAGSVGTTDQVVANVDVASNVPAGSYSFNLSATVDGCTFFLTVNTTVNAATCTASVLTFASAPLEIAATVGSATSTEVWARSDQSRAFAASLSGAPSGVTLSSVTNGIGTSDQVVAKIDFATTVAEGSYSFSLVATVDGCELVLPVNATVSAVTCASSMLTFDAGTQLTVDATAGAASTTDIFGRSDQSRPFGATLSNAPANVALTSVASTVGTNTQLLARLSIPATLAAGTYSFDIAATASGCAFSLPVTLNLTASCSSMTVGFGTTPLKVTGTRGTVVTQAVYATADSTRTVDSVSLISAPDGWIVASGSTTVGTTAMSIATIRADGTARAGPTTFTLRATVDGCPFTLPVEGYLTGWALDGDASQGGEAVFATHTNDNATLAFSELARHEVRVTTDAGDTWTSIPMPAGADMVEQLQIHPFQPNRFLGRASGPGTSQYSIYDGVTWAPQNSNVEAAAWAASTTNETYMVVFDGTTSQVACMQPGGNPYGGVASPWIQKIVPLSGGRTFIGFEPDPVLITVTVIDASSCSLTVDNLFDWRDQLGNPIGPPGPVHDVDGNGSSVYYATDQGVFRADRTTPSTPRQVNATPMPTWSVATEPGATSTNVAWTSGATLYWSSNGGSTFASANVNRLADMDHALAYATTGGSLVLLAARRGRGIDRRDLGTSQVTTLTWPSLRTREVAVRPNDLLFASSVGAASLSSTQQFTLDVISGSPDIWGVTAAGTLSAAHGMAPASAFGESLWCSSGAGWQQLQDPSWASFWDVAATNNALLAVGNSSTSGDTLWRLPNCSALPAGIPSGGRQRVAALGSNAILAGIFGEAPCRSSDGGLTWELPAGGATAAIPASCGAIAAYGSAWSIAIQPLPTGTTTGYLAITDPVAAADMSILHRFQFSQTMTTSLQDMTLPLRWVDAIQVLNGLDGHPVIWLQGRTSDAARPSIWRAAYDAAAGAIGTFARIGDTEATSSDPAWLGGCNIAPVAPLFVSPYAGGEVSMVGGAGICTFYPPPP